MNSTKRVALNQDIDSLMGIAEYSYDLSDLDFQAYCLRRGTLHVAGVLRSGYWMYFENHGRGKSEWLADEGQRFAQEYKGKRLRYTDADMDSLWTAVRIGRGKLQDCWEIYTASNN